MNELPNEITEITNYNDVDYPEWKYFFCYENYHAIVKHRNRYKLINETPNNGYLIIKLYDINKCQSNISLHKLIHHFWNEESDLVESDKE